MKDYTDQFSFILKPSTIEGAGVGVFAAHDIKEGTLLRLFGDKEYSEGQISTTREYYDVPDIFRTYCIYKEGGKILCPLDFGNMPLGWYLNHSENSNTIEKEDGWYTKKDIKEGEEILIDYNTFNEPEEYKDEYYAE